MKDKEKMGSKRFWNRYKRGEAESFRAGVKDVDVAKECVYETRRDATMMML